MNNQTKINNSKSSNAPLIIIGLVLVAAIVGGWWFYSSSKTPNKAASSNSNSAKNPNDQATALQIYQNAPAGAQPANLLGAANSSVTIEEFADYQCRTCAVMHTKMKEINALYSGRIKFIYRNFPLTQMHKNAYEASVAAEAAGMQGKFWAMQDQLFNNQQTWSNSSEARKIFEEYAVKIGLDLTKFQNDMAGLPAKTRVDSDLQRGRALSLSGTPTLFLNGNKLIPEQTEVAALRQLIDAELQKSSGQNAPGLPANQAVVVNSSNSNSSANSKK
ncbi:MAG: thioredoxin domain-containing protein [Pyrinomonadaceae bacterium]|nr:thioredoxin domain-containing protein [Pyrinomonadaceae bacterium]